MGGGGGSEHTGRNLQDGLFQIASQACHILVQVSWPLEKRLRYYYSIEIFINTKKSINEILQIVSKTNNIIKNSTENNIWENDMTRRGEKMVSKIIAVSIV